jgi:hypothetical protein
MTQHDSSEVEVTAKASVFHDEEVVEEIDREITPWQCLRQNPKIVMWSLFANSKRCTLLY